MKTSALSSTLLGAAAVVNAQWWGGAPDCAQTCFSSYWSSQSTWPAPTSYCGAGATQGASVSSCINSACSSTPTAVTSYASLSSSLCSQWSSCSSAGSTGVYTVSAPGFTGSWGPGSKYGPPGGGAGGGGPGGGPWGGASGTRTWSGGVYTVTGCEWNGSPWAGGPGGWGPGGAAGGGPWGDWGKGWTWTTATQTVTQTFTVTNAAGVTGFSTSVGLATVAQAVSGDQTSTTILSGGQVTGTSSNSGAAASDVAGVKVMGVLLGGVVAVAGML
ncbi:hypothetical protein QBC46DRAFT_343591 [Diplogelasinospora grovesii]|uniref:Extracellular membrane protein CFEM domain-containing protein n=1 Tax=Diplogelasinospora grovesii TaxID=303347 RepID=A0AAN6N401_9PEZI|nr:hypothetical protein QBC46DRAFT_343591 [Diplogelasinospora grovesii]